MCWAYFINRTGLPLFCEKFGAIATPSAAGWQAVQQAVQQAVRQYTGRFESFYRLHH